MDDLDKQLAELQLINNTELPPNPTLQRPGTAGRKVGPVVPPKPKKPQPQISDILDNSHDKKSIEESFNDSKQIVPISHPDNSGDFILPMADRVTTRDDNCPSTSNQEREGSEEVFCASKCDAPDTEEYDQGTLRFVKNRNIKEFNLRDEDLASFPTKSKMWIEDANFKILKITNTTVEDALKLMLHESFGDSFNRATHWFLIIVQVVEIPEDIDAPILKTLPAVFAPTKPVIVQWQSLNSSKRLIFYRQPPDEDFASVEVVTETRFTEDDLVEELTPTGSFSLSLLLKALSHCLGGSFGGDLTRVHFDVEREFDTWRFIDYAARDDDALSLRFLRLVDWDLAAIKDQRVLDIAAMYAGPQSISALLDLPVIGTGGDPSLSSAQKELLSLTDVSNNTPLTIAVEEGRIEALEFLVRCGADLSYRKRVGGRHSTPVDIAWERKLYDKVLVLLEADSPFPDGFDLDVLKKDKATAALVELVERRESFHRAIASNNHSDVKHFIDRYPQLKYAYNSGNQSALVTALESRQFETFALLESKRFSAGDDGHILALLNTLSLQEKDELKHAKHKYFEKEGNAHITFLLSKCKTHRPDSKDHTPIVRELFERLNEIPEASTILKVVEHAETVEIIFDFNKDSIADLDPTNSSATSGSCDYKAGRLYIGAKQPYETLGTLAHELAHLAMQTVFGNECNPYTQSDESMKSEFAQIIKEYHERKAIDSIIARVFAVYKNPKDWPSELIVRIPHLLAHYSQKGAHPKGREELEDEAFTLFAFYEERVQPQLAEFLEDPTRFKAQRKLRHLNDMLGQLEALRESRIWLKSQSLLREQLDFSGMLVLTSPLPQLTKTEFYQVLRRGQDRSSLQHRYVFTTVAHFKNDKQAEEIYDAFQSSIKPVLAVDCSRGYDTNQHYLWQTIGSFREQRRIVFIADAHTTKLLATKCTGYQMSVINREYSWTDLDDQSQAVLLEHSIDFQGNSIGLNQLVTPTSNLTKALPFIDLVEGKQIEIGRRLPIAYGYDERYYINRILNHYVVINPDVLSDQTSGKFSDLLAFTETEFDELHREYPRKNVHWLIREEADGKLVWQQSIGSLHMLRKYIDYSHTLPYHYDSLDKLLSAADTKRVIVISDTAGMGKTVVLTHLSRIIKSGHPSTWVVKFDLSENTDKLEEQEKKKLSAMQFLCEILEFNSVFEKAVFTELLRLRKVVLMLDSFDEISPRYKAIVLDLLRQLKDAPLRQLWITTRPHLKESLEDELLEFSYSLEPFSLNDQIEFLIKFWRTYLRIPKTDIERKMEVFGRALIEKLAESIKDQDRNFTGVPLQTRMLAEAFAEDFCEFEESGKSKPQMPSRLDLLGVYERFLDRKYLIYVSEKNNPYKINVATKELVAILKGGTNLRKIHQQLALDTLFPQQKTLLLGPLKHHTLPPEQLNRIGIVQYTRGKARFIHRTFAEYYVADFIVYQFSKMAIHSREVQDFLLNQVFRVRDYEIIRSFVNGLLGISPPSEKVVLHYGDRIKELWKKEDVENSPLKKYQMLLQEVSEERWKHGSKDSIKVVRVTMPPSSLRDLELRIHSIWENKPTTIASSGGTILHQTVQEGNPRILDFLLDGLRNSGYTDTIKSLLLFRNSDGQTVWYGAVVSGHPQIFEKLLEVIQALGLNQPEFTGVLLANDEDDRTTWHWVAWRGSEVLRKLWVLFHDKMQLLSLRDKYGRTIWHWITQYASTDLFIALWDLARGIGFDFREDLLPKKDSTGKNVWHYATQNENVEMLQTVWRLASEAGVDLKEELLMASDTSKQTAWHLDLRSPVLRQMWTLSQEAGLDTKEWLLKESKDQVTPWEGALRNGRPEILETLWECAQKAGIDRRMDLLLRKGKEDLGIFHWALYNDHFDTFDKLWELARGSLTMNELKSLLLHPNSYGQTPWFYACRNNDKYRLEKLWSWIATLGLRPEELRAASVARDKYNQTAWHWGACNGHPGILQKLWDLHCAIESEVEADLSVLLTRDTDNKTPFDWAVEHCMLNSLQKIWELIADATLDQKRDLFIGKSRFGHNVWYAACATGNLQMMQMLLDFSNEVDALSKEAVFQVKDKFGRGCWSVALLHAKPEFIEYLWNLARELGADLKIDLILNRDNGNHCSWHWVVENQNPGAIDKLWALTEEAALDYHESKQLFLVESSRHNTPWSLAVQYNASERLVKLWQLMTKRIHLEREELKEMLLFKAEEDRTAWHWIASNGNLEMLEVLESFAEEIGAAEAFRALIDEADEEGHTALELAVSEGYLEVAVGVLKRGGDVNRLSAEGRARLEAYNI